ncbi:uncharacterized protein BT62DRAFT_932794 [Guyanagaster necrorhizus]|uniref:Uncharacterized protein n=1 Tax=Guyanagaster necrorhizus TaxID=856835 RepID=A0A9P8ARR3_9AGAR|nr:uncharacterized protein BT62DRAFT_932794 [Guyanagaster necrorhizus MCA 3950]KAG7445638.1 hypothetical protein BT62DRAFT_932794 [Guyanagaster necrorhizus MCA 3950]
MKTPETPTFLRDRDKRENLSAKLRTKSGRAGMFYLSDPADGSAPTKIAILFAEARRVRNS